MPKCFSKEELRAIIKERALLIALILSCLWGHNLAVDEDTIQEELKGANTENNISKMLQVMHLGGFLTYCTVHDKIHHMLTDKGSTYLEMIQKE
jgi:hypothetical protein